MIVMKSQSRIFRFLICFFCMITLVIFPSQAFTANSLDITVNENGDATALFRFTLEGLLENAIPQSILQDELLKGLSTSSEPPTLISMDRSSASIILKKFARVADVPTGTEYTTASMNFKKAEIALQESALSRVVTADFSPASITVTLPDGYNRKFGDVDVLPSLTHTIIDPAKVAKASAVAQKGSIVVTTSPEQVQVLIDNVYAGDSPATFDEMAPGTYTLTLQKEGFEPIKQTVVVEVGNTSEVSANMKYSTTPTATPASPGFTGISVLLGLSCCAGILWLKRRPDQ
jgi:hypothetical protein